MTRVAPCNIQWQTTNRVLCCFLRISKPHQEQSVQLNVHMCAGHYTLYTTHAPTLFNNRQQFTVQPLISMYGTVYHILFDYCSVHLLVYSIYLAQANQQNGYVFNNQHFINDKTTKNLIKMGQFFQLDTKYYMIIINLRYEPFK